MFASGPDFNSPVLFSALQQPHSPSPWLLLMWAHLGLWPWKHILQRRDKPWIWGNKWQKREHHDPDPQLKNNWTLTFNQWLKMCLCYMKVFWRHISKSLHSCVWYLLLLDSFRFFSDWFWPGGVNKCHVHIHLNLKRWELGPSSWTDT